LLAHLGVAHVEGIMKLLDLFSGAGGAGMGYHRAGFEVVGVDNRPQKHYPFEFHQADAFDYLRDHGHEFDVIHASPPCQEYSRSLSHLSKTKRPKLITLLRDLLIGRVFVIENVPGSPLSNPALLCGAMFGLRTYRHRLFECSHLIMCPNHPPHTIPASRAGHYKPETFISVAGNASPIAMARKEMGCEWMDRHELCEAIPPAYTEYIGKQLLKAMETK
jgi:DNA (cytosine-5)-methyltransferase 1